jgi:hypothetical protein
MSTKTWLFDKAHHTYIWIYFSYTPCCIIVTAKGITAKDSESSSPGLIGKRDGVLLVHPSILIGFVRMMRNYVIENATGVFKSLYEKMKGNQNNSSI